MGFKPRLAAVVTVVLRTVVAVVVKFVTFSEHYTDTDILPIIRNQLRTKEHS